MLRSANAVFRSLRRPGFSLSFFPGLSLGFGAAVFASAPARADEPPALAPCTAEQAEAMEKEIVRWLAQGERDIYYLQNSEATVVGFFATDRAQDTYAEVCEPLAEPGRIVAREWYVWESAAANADPRAWKAGERHAILQEDGAVELRVIESGATGAARVELRVIGRDLYAGEKIVRADAVTFVVR